MTRERKQQKSCESREEKSLPSDNSEHEQSQSGKKRRRGKNKPKDCEYIH